MRPPRLTFACAPPSISQTSCHSRGAPCAAGEGRIFSSIPAGDRSAAHTNPWAVGTATLINGSILALLLCMGLGSISPHLPNPALSASAHIDDLSIFSPRNIPGSQGGGQNDLVDASRGRLPRIEKQPLAPPQIPVLQNPRLAVDSAMAAPPNVKLPDDPSLVNIGLPFSSNVTVISGGPGSHSGIGNGDRDGVGPGHGIGFGPNSGDGVYTPGGDVSAPVPLFTPEADFSDEARRNKFQGVCMISVIIDTHGRPADPRIVRHLGQGLDEKALEAVQRYRFKPAMRHGHPVAARIVVAVDFRLF